MTIQLNHRARGLMAIRADGGNADKVIEELQRTFETFKAEHTKEQADIKKKLGDVVQSEKVDRINGALDAQMKRIDDLALKSARPVLEGTRRDNSRSRFADGASREHKSAFEAYVRQGESGALRALETKAMSAGSNADGGYGLASPNLCARSSNRTGIAVRWTASALHSNRPAELKCTDIKNQQRRGSRCSDLCGIPLDGRGGRRYPP